ncbi:MAG: hypothetical protein QNL80_12545 [Akkermansiaceae bacterium]|jgi:hypothetical protein
MRFALLFVATLLLNAPLFAQQPNIGNLTLVDEGGFNELDIRISAVNASDSDTTALAGEMEVLLNLDYGSGTTDTMVIKSADISASDLEFRLRVLFFTVAEINAQGMKGSASTPDGIGPVDPASGEFDAANHTFTISEGIFSGEALGMPIDNNVSDTPITGLGAGTGTVTLANPVEGANRVITYDVTVTLPIAFDDTLPTGDGGVEADVTVSGTIKAVGTAFIIRPATYVEWAVEQGLAIDSQALYSLSENMSNDLIHALGHSAAEVPSFPLEKSENGLRLNVGLSGQAAEVVIEYSEDLVSWDPLSAVRLVSSPGDPMEVSTPDELGFYRVIVSSE